MRSSAAKRREFPALFMTALFVGASLASTGCLRKMTEPTQMPSPSYLSDDVQYFAPNPELKIARKAPLRLGQGPTTDK